MPATSPARPRALALGLILPLAISGAATAQQEPARRGAWVDPPARPAAVPDMAKGPDAKSLDAKSLDAKGPDVTSPDVKGPGKEAPPDPVRQAAKPAPEDALPKAAGTPAAGPNRAVALERPAGGEAPRAPHPRRLADMPAALSVTPVAAASSERGAAARSLAARYLATVSAPGDAMVGAAPRFYGTQVRFYGRPITLASLVAEKRSFVRRWPERRYEPRAIRTACDAQTCTVRAVVDFRAASPYRGAVSSGAAELILEVSFSGPHPVIVAETGRVLRRGTQAATLAPARGKA